MKNHPFDLEHYKLILSNCLDNNYKFIKFGAEISNKQKYIYLRHDIDNDVTAAFNMAKIEESISIKSTYLVMLRSKNYNPANKSNILLLKEILEMGHEVGLHFSLVDHPSSMNYDDLKKIIRLDADILSSLLNKKVKVFGFHNPSNPNEYKVNVNNLINTYAKEFFEDIHYISESNMKWANGCPCISINNNSPKKIQLLIHPYTYKEKLESDLDLMVYFLKEKLRDLLIYNKSQNRVLNEMKFSFDDLLKSFRKG